MCSLEGSERRAIIAKSAQPIPARSAIAIETQSRAHRFKTDGSRGVNLHGACQTSHEPHAFLDVIDADPHRYPLGQAYPGKNRVH
jgi:hypothetical protein